MTPQGSTPSQVAAALWPAPRWALALLLAMLGMLGPFAVDTYLPAFSGIAQTLQATPAQMQQTLSAFFLTWALMNLFHGALADSFGRRPVVLCGLAMFALASIGCALAQTLEQLVLFRALQGLFIGIGTVVSRAVIRDLFAPTDAQKVMSQVAMYHALAPAVAPLIGGWLYVLVGWHSIFWLLTGIAVALWLAVYKTLPETLAPEHVQSFRPVPLLRAYRLLLTDGRVTLLAMTSSLPFCAWFLYVLSAPSFLGEHLALRPTQFFLLFVMTVIGIIGGSWFSGRLAGRITPQRQIQLALGLMIGVALLNLLATLLFKPDVTWALFPLAGHAFGWALVMPSTLLLLLDLYPARRGMVSSLQAFFASASIGVMSAVFVPLILHSTALMSLTMLILSVGGGLCWWVIRRRWPGIGRTLSG